MRPYLSVLVVVAVAGCAASGSTPAPSTAAPEPAGSPATTATTTAAAGAGAANAPPVLRQEFVASYERVWQALPGAYADVGLKVNVADTTTRAVGFAGDISHRIGRVPLSKYFECGSTQGDNNADSYQITLVAASQVGRSPEGRIIVTTSLRASGRAPQFANVASNCASKGTLEPLIFQALRARLGLH